MNQVHSKLIKQSLVVVPPPPSRFTLSEWHLQNGYRNRICVDQLRLADSVILETDRMIDEVNERTDTNKKDTDNKLKQKIEDIKFNESEILDQRKKVVIEIENLTCYQERIKDAMNSLKEDALKIVRKCLVMREGRLGIDLCSDVVDIEMKKELKVIEGAQSLLVRLSQEANEQIRRLRSTIYFMDRDLEDKGNVLKIDRHNKDLTNTSLNLSIYHGFGNLDPATVTLQEWERYTRNNIENGAKEINSARQLRSYTDTLLRQVIDDLRTQCHACNNAFRQRIEEYKHQKTKMEIQHAEVARQVNELLLAITRLEKSIAEKEGYMALAHTRLGNRAQRPGMELCKDNVTFALTTEVAELRANLAELQVKMSEARASLRYLLKTQVQLEEDINIKTNSIKIDEVDCMTIRQAIDYHAY